MLAGGNRHWRSSAGDGDMASTGLDDDMLPSERINVDRNQAVEGIGPEIGIGAQFIDTCWQHRQLASLQPCYRCFQSWQERIYESSRVPRPRRAGTGVAFASRPG